MQDRSRYGSGRRRSISGAIWIFAKRARRAWRLKRSVIYWLTSLPLCLWNCRDSAEVGAANVGVTGLPGRKSRLKFHPPSFERLAESVVRTHDNLVGALRLILLNNDTPPTWRGAAGTKRVINHHVISLYHDAANSETCKERLTSRAIT